MGNPEIEPEPDTPEDYTAFQKREYRQIIYRTQQNHSWRNLPHSYFFACEPLIAQLAIGQLREDIEGTAAIFLFRHFLELAFKQIIFMGRVVKVKDENLHDAVQNQIVAVRNIHGLAKLWEWVLNDAKPQIEHWDNYDTETVEKCVQEFNAIDPKGFAFRYAGQGGEYCRYDFGALREQMNHIREVLDGLFEYLEQMNEDIMEYEDYLSHEFGNEDF